MTFGALSFFSSRIMCRILLYFDKKRRRNHDELFSPYQCLYDLWRLGLDFHFHIFLLQLRRLVGRVQPCFVHGVSGCSRVQDRIASTFLGFPDFPFTLFCLLPLPPGHALHGAVLEEGRQAAAEAVGDQVRHQAAGLAHLLISFFLSYFGIS